VNAAGAWADQLAQMAGVAEVGLMALRRTAFVTTISSGIGPCPLVLAADNSCYFKPDVPGVMHCSRADETQSQACAPKADEIDVAMAIERINSLTTLGIRSVQRAWAGLRVFAPDRQPVVQADESEPSFIWGAGLGGTGIQTSPAVGMVVADLVGGLLV